RGSRRASNGGGLAMSDPVDEAEFEPAEFEPIDALLEEALQSPGAGVAQPDRRWRRNAWIAAVLVLGAGVVALGAREAARRSATSVVPIQEPVQGPAPKEKAKEQSQERMLQPKTADEARPLLARLQRVVVSCRRNHEQHHSISTIEDEATRMTIDDPRAL